MATANPSPLANFVRQVTGKWSACHSSIRDLKLRVQELLNEFQTCGALYIPPKQNAEAQSLAQKAIESSSDSTNIARYASSLFHGLKASGKGLSFA